MLLDEIGPAHKKVFYIMLKLGIGTENEEVYEAQGSSIKKTQHAAADLALKQTKFKMPVKRDKTLSKSIDDSSTDNNQTSLTNSTAYSRFLTDADSKRQKKWTKTNRKCFFFYYFIQESGYVQILDTFAQMLI